MSSRLATGGVIDRQQSFRFSFDGRSYAGCAGDSLASALLANDVRLVGRSFKYHRPRGLLSAGPEEPNALVELRSGARREPNTRATVIELYDGLEATSQNRWPSLHFDVQAINGLFSPLFVAGFYYKTFMWPAVVLGEGVRAADPPCRRPRPCGTGSRSGSLREELGTLRRARDRRGTGRPGGGVERGAHRRTRHRGRRGLRARRTLPRRTRTIDGQPAADWAAQAIAELRSMPEVRLLPRTTVFGVYDDGVYGAVERVNDHLPVPPPFEPRQRVWRIVAKQSVLASGSIERPLVFGNNDLPGVMLAGAVRTYVNRYAVLPGKRAVVFTDNDDGWTTAADLAGRGCAGCRRRRLTRTGRRLRTRAPLPERRGASPAR